MQASGFGKKIFDDHDQRNTNEVVNRTACGKMTHRFVKGGKLDGPGKWSGSCGIRKDSIRVTAVKTALRNIGECLLVYVKKGA